ncbi:MAG: hypothetical protein ACKOCT_00365 [Alphaproteobacteria bacterium]
MKTSITGNLPARFGRLVAALLVLAAMFAGSFAAVFAGSATPASAESAAQLIDTDTIEDPFIQLNDGSRPDKDTFTIRGRVNVNPGSDPVPVGVANGAIALVYEAGSTLGAFVLVETQIFDPSECTAKSSGRSLICRNSDGSFLRLRSTQSNPGSYQANVYVKRQEFSPGKPFELPLSAEIQIGGFDWIGSGVINYCTVSHNGDRTTCRASKAGPG